MRVKFRYEVSMIGSALVGGILLTSCIGEQPCIDAESAFGVVAIPATLIDSVESITTEGPADCKILSDVGACDAEGCEDGVGGIKIKRYYVRAANEGNCTVIVKFSNGCRAAGVDLSFGGPSNNCCANVCERSGSAQLPEDCQAN